MGISVLMSIYKKEKPEYPQFIEGRDKRCLL